MISGRGALISGMLVPSADSDEEVGYKGVNDLEIGIEPPDSDYASYAPPNIFPSIKSEKCGPRSKTEISLQNDDKIDHTEEAIDDDDDLGQIFQFAEKRQRQSLLYVLACILCVLIGAAITVGVILLGNKSSPAPLTPCQQELSSAITLISDAATLDEPTSSQAKAYHWLVFNDSLCANEHAVVTNEMAVQRYVLAVFYFATSGPETWSANTWLQGPECNGNTSWTGINCNTKGQVRALVLGKCTCSNASQLSTILTISASFVLHFKNTKDSLAPFHLK